MSCHCHGTHDSTCPKENTECEESRERKRNFLFLGIGVLLLLAAFLLSYFDPSPFKEMSWSHFKDSDFFSSLTFGSFVLYSFDYLILSYTLITKMVEEIREKNYINEFTLMLVATIGAFAICEFPEAVLVVLFSIVGEMLEDYATEKSSQSIKKLVNDMPLYAHVLQEDGTFQDKNPETLPVGSILEIRPGEKIAVDGILAKGKTTIYNAACEPYIQQLCRMLNQMGAKISGVASNLITIEGVSSLQGATHTILPDMIEVGSFIGMAAMTASELTIKNVSYENLGIIPQSFRRLGIKLEQCGDDIVVPEQHNYQIESFIDGSIMTIADAPWPGLTPDLLSVMLVVATQANGSVLIHQKMFESRLFFVDKLIDMGAQIILCDPHRAVVIGHNHRIPLMGGNMTSPDIRAGIAMLIAAMSAEGTSRIHNIEQIDRGYQNIELRLNSIGAKITRI